MYVLQCTQKAQVYRYSPIYDMESYFWVFLFEVLHKDSNNLTQSEKDDIYEKIVPEEYGDNLTSNSDKKAAILHDLSNKFRSWDEDFPHLLPYKTLVEKLIIVVDHFYDAATGRIIQKMCREDEERAILLYISVFKDSLFQLGGQ